MNSRIQLSHPGLLLSPCSTSEEWHFHFFISIPWEDALEKRMATYGLENSMDCKSRTRLSNFHFQSKKISDYLGPTQIIQDNVSIFKSVIPNLNSI